MIIGYIHICQTKAWKKSFHILMNCLRKSSIYKNIKEIRLGVLVEENKKIDMSLLKDPLFKIIKIGKPAEYERATLHHMRDSSELDPDNTKYFYLHTKGVKWLNTYRYKYITDWINLMLFWNIEKWELAIEKLKEYDTYGCNKYIKHYAGNFWWANSHYIKKLPKRIGLGYCQPEDWLFKLKNGKYYSAFNSNLPNMGHYKRRYPRYLYVNKKEI